MGSVGSVSPGDAWRRILRAALAASCFGSVACGVFLNVDDDDDPQPPNETASSGVDAAPPPAPVVEGGAPPPPPCTSATKVIELTPVADTCPPRNDCAGSISYGGATFCNVGVGVFLARFGLGDDAASALRSGKVIGMTLSFQDNRTCDSASGCPGSVPPRPGSFGVHVLRNDWVERSSASTYSGADYCRRTSGNPGNGWGMSTKSASAQTAISSPADYGVRIGGGAIASSDVTSVSLPLDPSKVALDWARFEPDSGSAPWELSFFVEAEGEGRIVVGTRESKMAKPPVLRLEICE